MASLSGNKIKDTYNLLLKLESAEVSASEQTVEDGAGNDTALKISTDTVETTGELKISGTPSTSTTLTKALMLDTSGVVVTRDLNTNPIGTASITANSPLSATGSTVEVDDAGNLSQITAPANNDKYLIWDESASAYKYIDQSDLTSHIASNSTINQSQMLVAKLQSDTTLSTSATTALGFAEIHGDSSATGSTSAATSSVMFGLNTNNFLSLNNVSDPRDAILINEKEGYFRITASLELDSTTNNDAELFIYDVSGTKYLATSFRTTKTGETYHAEFSAVFYSDGLAGYNIQIRGYSGGNNIIAQKAESFVSVEYIGSSISF